MPARRSEFARAALVIAAALSLGLPATGFAGTWEEDRPHVHQHQDAGDALREQDYKGAPKDLVLWGDLARTRVVRSGGRFRATIPPSVRALDGRTVTLLGFMAPVHAGTRHTQFLLSDKRFLCEGCDSAPGPESIVEVNVKTGEPVRQRPLFVRGKLEVVRDDPDGLVYRLNGAKVIRRVR